MTTPAQTFDDVIVAAVTDTGEVLDAGTAARLIKVPARADAFDEEPPPPMLAQAVTLQEADVTASVQQKLEHFLNEESEKLDHWQEDAEAAFKREQEEVKKDIAAKQKLSRAATLGLQDKLDLKREIAALKAKETTLKRTHFERLDEISRERDRMLDEVEAKLQMTPTVEPLFEVRWSLE